MSNHIPRQIILPSIWKPLSDKESEFLDRESFTSICDEAECTYREKIKKAITEISKEAGINPSAGVFSMIPVSMEIALEHVNVKNFKEAIKDYATVVEIYLSMLQSKSMESTIKSAIEAEENNLDW